MSNNFTATTQDSSRFNSSSFLPNTNNNFQNNTNNINFPNNNTNSFQAMTQNGQNIQPAQLHRPNQQHTPNYFLQGGQIMNQNMSQTGFPHQFNNTNIPNQNLQFTGNRMPRPNYNPSLNYQNVNLNHIRLNNQPYRQNTPFGININQIPRMQNSQPHSNNLSLSNLQNHLFASSQHPSQMQINQVNKRIMEQLQNGNIINQGNPNQMMGGSPQILDQLKNLMVQNKQDQNNVHPPYNFSVQDFQRLLSQQQQRQTQQPVLNNSIRNRYPIPSPAVQPQRPPTQPHIPTVGHNGNLSLTPVNITNPNIVLNNQQPNQQATERTKEIQLMALNLLQNKANIIQTGNTQRPVSPSVNQTPWNFQHQMNDRFVPRPVPITGQPINTIPPQPSITPVINKPLANSNVESDKPKVTPSPGPTTNGVSSNQTSTNEPEIKPIINKQIIPGSGEPNRMANVTTPVADVNPTQQNPTQQKRKNNALIIKKPDGKPKDIIRPAQTPSSSSNRHQILRTNGSVKKQHSVLFDVKNLDSNKQQNKPTEETKVEEENLKTETKPLETVQKVPEPEQKKADLKVNSAEFIPKVRKALTIVSPTTNKQIVPKKPASVSNKSESNNLNSEDNSIQEENEEKISEDRQVKVDNLETVEDNKIEKEVFKEPVVEPVVLDDKPVEEKIEKQIVEEKVEPTVVKTPVEEPTTQVLDERVIADSPKPIAEEKLQVETTTSTVKETPKTPEKQAEQEESPKTVETKPKAQKIDFNPFSKIQNSVKSNPSRNSSPRPNNKINKLPTKQIDLGKGPFELPKNNKKINKIDSPKQQLSRTNSIGKDSNTSVKTPVRDVNSVKQYTREVLLRFQPKTKCLETPPDWNANKIPAIMSDTPNKEVAMIVNEMDKKRVACNVDITLINARKITGNRKDSRQDQMYNRSNQQNIHQPSLSNRNPKKIEISHKIPKLTRDENAFVFKKKNPNEKTAAQEFIGKLNKLCPENYKTIHKQLLDINIYDDQAKMDEIIKIIFETALDSVHFAEVYARLCHDITFHNKDINRKRKTQVGKEIDFRSTLLSQVQQQFEKFKTTKAKNETTSRWDEYIGADKIIISHKEKQAKAKATIEEAKKEKEEFKENNKSRVVSRLSKQNEVSDETFNRKFATDAAWISIKDKFDKADLEIKNTEEDIIERTKKLEKRRFNNLTFIGHLFMKNLIIPRIIHECCVSPLLKEPDNERIDELYKLLIIIGAKLEECPPKNPKGNHQNMRKIKSYYDRIQELFTNYKTFGLNMKSACHLQDLMEYHSSNWKNVRTVSGPKTIDEIHKDIKDKEKKEQEQLDQIVNHPVDDYNKNSGNFNQRGNSYNRGGNRTNITKNSHDARRGYNVDSNAIKPRTGAFDKSKFDSLMGNKGKTSSIERKMYPGFANKNNAKGSTDNKVTGALTSNNKRLVLNKNKTNPYSNAKMTSRAESSKKAMEDMQRLLSRKKAENSISVDEAIKRGDKILADVLNGNSMEEFASDWYNKETIPNRHLCKIVERKLDDVCINKTAKEQVLFGQFFRHLILKYKDIDRPSDCEDQILLGMKECISNWCSCESWADAPKLWDNLANVVQPLFSGSICPKLPVFGNQEFKKIVDYCYFKDEYCEFNYKGVFAAYLLKKMVNTNTKITDNEYKLRKFWNNTKLHWSNLYNEETDTEFFAVLQSTNMKYLYDYELILDQTSKLRDIQQYMNMFIDDGLLDIDSFKQNFQDLYDSTRIMEDTKRNKEGVNKEFAWTKNTVTALIGHLTNLYSEKYLLTTINETLQSRFIDMFEISVYEIMTQFDSKTFPNLEDSLEMEVIYTAENIYARLHDQNQCKQIRDILSLYWDAMLLSKDTICKKWKTINHHGRGLNKIMRENMIVECASCINIIENAESDEED